MFRFSTPQSRLPDRWITPVAQVGSVLSLTYLLALPASCATQASDNSPRVSGAGEAEFLDVHYADDLFVAVGTNTASGPSFDLDSYVVTSSDGLTWVERYRAPGTILNSVAFGAGRWVAVGWGRDNEDRRVVEMLTSEDGQDWRPQPALEVDYLKSIVWTGEAFVLLGERISSETRVFRSTNGIDWVEQATLAYLDSPRLVSHEGTLIAAGGTIFVSYDDGQTWSASSGLSDQSWVSGIWPSAMQFRGISVHDCCFGEVPARIETYTISSDDGLTWTETRLDRYTFVPRGVVMSDALEVGFNSRSLAYREPGGPWTIGPRGHFEDLTYVNGVFVAVGAWVLKWSRDGKVWQEGAIPSD